MTDNSLRDNNEFYRRFWHEHPLYLTPFPNSDEGERAAVILRFLSVMLETMPPTAPRSLRMLDLGCGRGWLTQLASLFGACEGCEPTPEAVALARQLFPNLVFHCGTLDMLLASPGFRAFDLVLSSEVIEHIPAAGKAAFVDQIKAALVRGGHCIVTTPRGELQSRVGHSSNQLIEEWLTEKELLDLFRSRGFQPVRSDRAYPTRATRLDRLYLGLSRRLERLGLRIKAPSIEQALAYRSALYQVWWFRLGSA